jgi:hypothetical protein
VHALGSLRPPSRFSRGGEGPRAGSVWVHFGVLIGVIVCSHALRSDDASLFSVLYAWMPVLAGVSISIRPANRRNVMSSVLVALAAAFGMMALDITGSYQEGGRSSGAFLFEGRVQQRETITGVVQESWVRTGGAWISGNLEGVDIRSEAYSEGHPRLLAVEALGELSLLLLCFATTGIVLGVCSWLSRHARFDSRPNEAGARIAVAWLVAAGVVLLTQGGYASSRFQVLFNDADLWTLLLPSFGFLALGAVGFWMAARSDDRRSADRP